MLYSLLVSVLLLAFFNALIVPFLVIRSFIKGYNINAETKIDVTSLSDVVSRKEKPKIDQKTATILRNIDRYDGTSHGQEEVR